MHLLVHERKDRSVQVMSHSFFLFNSIQSQIGI